MPSTAPPPNRAVTEVTHDDEATEVERYLGGWFSVDDSNDFDRELDDDPRRRVGDGSRRRAIPRFATGTGQFDLRSGEPHDSADEALVDETLIDAASAPLSLIMAHRVSCVRSDLDASEARSRMLARGVSGMPVVDNWGRALGVVSKTDLVEHSIGEQPTGLLVGDIMTPLVFSLTPDDSIGRAAALMAYEGVHRVVVVDRGGYVVGLVSSLDIARWLGRRAGHPIGQEG